MPVLFLFRYTGGRATCLRCALMTRHEYGVDISSEAASNDGMQEAKAPGAKDVSVGRAPASAAGVTADMFACFGSSSACSKLAMLFGETGKRKTR